MVRKLSEVVTPKPLSICFTKYFFYREYLTFLYNKHTEHLINQIECDTKKHLQSYDCRCSEFYITEREGTQTHTSFLF